MISIVCIFNDKKLLNSHLLKSLSTQNANYELILLDNRFGKYDSAANGLNIGCKKATSEYLMCVHQDIELPFETWLNDVEDILNDLPNLGIAGVAGMKDLAGKNKDRGRNVIRHGVPAKNWSWGKVIEKPEIVQTLDECLFIIPKKVFIKLKFDDNTCNSWHLYATDYCLSCRNLDLYAYVIPFPVYHLGGSKVNRDYYISLRKLMKKHKERNSKIYTTCGEWDTTKPIVFMKFSHLLSSISKLLLGELK